MAASADDAVAGAVGSGEEAIRALRRLRADTHDPATREIIDRAVTALLALQQRAESAEAESLRDPLTGLANRRAWDEALRAETERCRRENQGAVVVVLDVDDFKAYNDGYGHLAGDLLLRRVGQTLARVSRTTDVVARIGGDEFALIAVGADDSSVVKERLQTALAQAEASVSLGARRAEPGEDLAAAWQAADRDMYADKVRRRRGRVT